MITEMNTGSPILVTLSQMPSQSKRFKASVLKSVAQSSRFISYVLDGSKPNTFLVYLYPGISADQNQDRYAAARQDITTGCRDAAESWIQKLTKRQPAANNLRRTAPAIRAIGKNESGKTAIQTIDLDPGTRFSMKIDKVRIPNGRYSWDYIVHFVDTWGDHSQTLCGISVDSLRDHFPKSRGASTCDVCFKRANGQP